LSVTRTALRCWVTERAGRPLAAGREGDLGEHGGGVEHLAQGAPVLQQPVVVLSAVQPVGAGLRARRLDEQIVEIAFAIGDVDRTRLGEALGQGVDPGEAIDPGDALLVFERAAPVLRLAEAARLAREAVHVEQAQRHPLGGDHQCRMQVHPPATFRIQHTQAADDALFLGVVQLRRILDAQHPRVRTQACFGAGDMRGEHRLGGDRVVVEQPIGRPGLVPTAAGPRKTQRRFCAQGLHQALRAPIQSPITQVDAGQFRCEPVHQDTPKAARKSRRSG
jgi:hypothetical protein